MGEPVMGGGGQSELMENIVAKSDSTLPTPPPPIVAMTGTS